MPATLTIRENGTPERSLAVTDYVSPSRLKLWLRCPLAFKLRYIDGIITPTTPSLFLGQVVHRGLEFYYRYRARGVTLFPEVVAEHIKDVWHGDVAREALQFKNSADESALKQKACDLVAAYLEQVPDNEPPPVAVEQRFKAPLVDPASGENLGIPLMGILDLVLDESPGPVIVDFKTAQRSSNQVDVMHEIQMSSYAYLFRHATGQTENALEIRSLIKTKSPKVETHRYAPRSEAHFERLFSVIRAYLDAVGGSKFHIRPGLECSFCDYRDTFCQRTLVKTAPKKRRNKAREPR